MVTIGHKQFDDKDLPEPSTPLGSRITPVKVMGMIFLTSDSVQECLNEPGTTLTLVAHVMLLVGFWLMTRRFRGITQRGLRRHFRLSDLGLRVEGFRGF